MSFPWNVTQSLELKPVDLRSVPIRPLRPKWAWTISNFLPRNKNTKYRCGYENSLPSNKSTLSAFAMHTGDLRKFRAIRKNALALQIVLFLGIHALLSARRMSIQRQRLKAFKLLLKYHKIMPRSREFTEYLKMLVPGFFTWSKIKKSVIRPAYRLLGRLTGKSQLCDKPMVPVAKTKQQKNSHLVCEPPLMPYENR